MITNDQWLTELQGLAYRYTYLGVTADLASMDLLSLWGLYCYLKRLAESAS